MGISRYNINREVSKTRFGTIGNKREGKTGVVYRRLTLET